MQTTHQAVSNRFKLRCIKCNSILTGRYASRCENCSGLIEAEYTLQNARLVDSLNPYVRFADLLPVDDVSGLLPSDERYTPCVHAVKMGAMLGTPNLYLKDETAHPTGTA